MNKWLKSSVFEIFIILFVLEIFTSTVDLSENKCTQQRSITDIHSRTEKVDPETEEILGPNQQGELRVKSRFVMNGYFNLDSSDSFDRNGWLKTGDIVYYDQDRCFYVVDRIKEMLKYKSWHVAPAMIENILHNHAAIKKAVVIGIPDEEDGDHPMAVVILNNPHENITAEEIEAYVAERVQDRQKLRAGVKFVDAVPITPSGKVKRRDLKNMVLAGEI